MVKTKPALFAAGVALALAFTFFACSSSSDDPPAPQAPASDDRVFEKKFVAEGINFVSSKAEITDDSFAYLTNIAEIMKTHPEVTFRIIGYTDDAGRQEASQKLSEERAKAVMDFLISKGARGLEYQGKGQEDPIANNKTAEGRAKNRRIEIHYDGDFEFN